ncbi:MAG: glycerophosphodiester phosphodiesterase [Clostridia bacterium]|nr:glycerophosphodiester phosphodiesterase [Clostridia bacterium]
MITLPKRPLIIAHRGASGYHPENTLPSFAAAVEMQADAIELDVHYTKDREIVVSHDATIDRLSNGQGRIALYTLEELKHFDFGYKFYKGCRGIRIPTLAEVYELLKDTKLYVNVEIKGSDPQMPADLDALARRYGMEDRVFYSSFCHWQLARMKAVAPDALVAPLYGAFSLHDAPAYAKSFGAAAIHPDMGDIFEMPEIVARAHSLGQRVHVWAPNSEEHMERLLRLGCDGLIMDYPDRARKILESI